MPRIKLEFLVEAPIQVVFDLSRSIDVHQESQTRYREKAVGGRTSGLIELGESVTWEATHFGIRQRLTSRITAMRPPFHFRDSMVSGAFKRFDHDHYFEATPSGGTRVRDVFDYTSPGGVIGRLFDWACLRRYMTNLLRERNSVVKALAEAATPR